MPNSVYCLRNQRVDWKNAIQPKSLSIVLMETYFQNLNWKKLILNSLQKMSVTNLIQIDDAVHDDDV